MNLHWKVSLRNAVRSAVYRDKVRDRKLWRASHPTLWGTIELSELISLFITSWYPKNKMSRLSLQEICSDVLTRCFSNGMIIRTTVMNICFIHSRPVEFQSSTERDFQWYYPPVIMVLPNSTSQVHSWPGNTSARGTARSRCISPQDNLQLAGNDRQMFLLPELSRLTGVLRRQHGTMVSQVPAIVKTAEQAPLYRCEYDLYKPISELLWNLIV